MYDFDTLIDRRGTTSIKYNKQRSFGVKDGLLPFWIADMDFATVPAVTEALEQRLKHPLYGYAEPLPSFRKSIQGWWERRHDWRPETEWMVPGCGVVTCIFLTLNTLLEKGDKVMVFSPIYDPFFRVIQNSGHTLVDCPMLEEDDTYHIDFDALEKELKNGVKAVLFCNPHNPVARVWTAEEVEHVVRLCAQYNVYLLSDEVHGDIAIDGHKYTPAGKYSGEYDRVVIYTAVSKTFNLAGMISSCMIIPNAEIRQKMVDCLDMMFIDGCTDLAYSAIEAAYTHGDQWVDELCAYLSGNAHYIQEFCKERMPEVKLYKHEGTFLMWMNLRCMNKSSDEMTAILAKEYGLAIGNGSHYGKQADGFMRFNFACPRATLEKGMNGMEKFYRDYLKK